jgi:hypothetical protein
MTSAFFDTASAEFSIHFVNDGGPLMVLPRELLPFWEGADRPSGGRVITTDADEGLGEFAGTDYARACSAGGWVSTISVGDGHGIILGAEEDFRGVQWLRLAETPGTMISLPMYAEEDTDQVLVMALRRTLDEGWREVFPAFQVASGELVLLHAANTGEEVREARDKECAMIGDAIPWQIEPGLYTVDERLIVLPTLPNPSPLVICRLRPVVAPEPQ